MEWLHHKDNIYIASKQLQYKCGDTAIDSNKYVNAGQNHVGRAGDLEEEWCWVHQRGDWPPVEGETQMYRWGEGKYKEDNKERRTVSNSPIEQQQQGQHRQVGGGDIGVLLETHKNDDNQCSRDDVVALQEEKRMIR